MTLEMPEKIWIFDTVVLSNFIFSDSLYLIERRYKRRGVITTEVYDEIAAGFSVGCYDKLQLIEGLIDRRVFRQITLNRKEQLEYKKLLKTLGTGEASTIALAQFRNGVVVSDDRHARMISRQKGIFVTGTIGILKAACLDKQLTLEDADVILGRMISEGFYSPVQHISDIV